MEIYRRQRGNIPLSGSCCWNTLEFAPQEIGEAISGKKTFKTAAKSVGKQTLRKNLGSRIKQRGIIPIISIEQTSRSRRDIFTKISR